MDDGTNKNPKYKEIGRREEVGQEGKVKEAERQVRQQTGRDSVETAGASLVRMEMGRMDGRSWLSTRVISGSTARPEPGESALRFEVQAPDGVSKDQEDGGRRGAGTAPTS